MLAVPATLAGEVGAVGDLYVVKYSGGDVLQFDGPTGAPVGTFASGGGDGGTGLVFGPNGNLFVCSYVGNKVIEYDGASGAYVGDFVTAGSGGLDAPEGLTFGPGGNLFVASYATDEVLEYDGLTGAFVGVFASESLGGPVGLTFGPGGNLFVADDSRVEEYDGTTGAYLGPFASGGGLDEAKGLAFGPNGNLFVCSLEWSTQTSSVIEYDGTTGELIGTFASEGLSAPYGLAFAPDGSLLVTNPAWNRFNVTQHYGDSGALFRTFASLYSAPQGLTFKPLAGPFPAPDVFDFSPLQADNCRPLVEATVSGTGLVWGARLTLTRSGEADLVGVITATAPDESELTVSFDLSAVAVGFWDLVLTYPDDQTVTLLDALEVLVCTPDVADFEPAWMLDCVPLLEGAVITGSDFTPGATVALTMAGESDIEGANVEVQSSTTIVADFDLSAAAIGLWGVEVTNYLGGTASGSLPDALELTACPPLEVTDFFPAETDNCDLLYGTTVSGSGFTAVTAVMLSRAGQADIPGTDVTVQSASTLVATFDLTDVAVGLWDVTVTRPDSETATLTAALEVTECVPPAYIGDLYVASFLNSKVVQFDGATGALVGDFVTQGSGGLGRAVGLAWGPNGNLFVVSDGQNAPYNYGVAEYDGTTGAFVGWLVGPSGGFVPTPETGWLSRPCHLAFGPDGALYVTGGYNEAVLKYDGTTGEWLGTFAIGGFSPGGLRRPQDLAFGPNGNLLVLSSYGAGNPTGEGSGIFEYHHATGRFVGALVDDFDASLTEGAELAGLLFRPNGNLLVSFAHRDLITGDTFRNEVMEYDGTTGQRLGAFVPDGSGLDFPCGMTWGPSGNLFVASFNTSSVLEFDGQTGATIGTFASGGGLSRAVDIAFKPAPPDPLPAPTITGFSVVQHDACDPLAGVTVTGTNLDPDQTTVMLSNPNEPLGTNGLVSTYVGLVTGGGGTWLTVDFDLDGGARMAGGEWDAEVLNPDGQSDTLAAAIDVAPCWTAGEENLFVLGYRARGLGRHGLFEFDGVTGDLIGFAVEDPSGTTGDDLGSSTGFLFGRDGNLLLVSVRQQSLLAYEGITGRKLGTFIPSGSGGMLEPHRLTFGPNGNLFVLHRHGSCAISGVLEFDGLTGALVRDFVSLGTCGIGCVLDIEFGPDGNLYVTDNADGVFVFDGQTGECLAAPLIPAPAEPGTCFGPLEFSPQNRNLVLPWHSNYAPPGEGLGRVTVHDPQTGDLLGTPIPPPAGDIQQAIASDFGPNGHLFVVGYPGYIFEYDLLAEQVLGIFATQSNASGQGLVHEIIFAPLLGDADGDWDVDAADAAAFDACFTGDGVPPENYNCLIFDFDRDGDVDCDDWWSFRNEAWTANPEPVPPFTPCGDPGDPLTGDLDGDWDVDAEDFAVFVQCLDGPDNPPNGGCPPGADADLDADGDVDLADFAAFQQVFPTTGTAGDPDGACCLADATCLEVTEHLCILFFNGAYQGDGTDCSAGCPTGACCLPDGSCADDMTEMACAYGAGIYQGDWTDCVSDPCPLGACCSPVDGSCTEITEAECNATHGAGAYQGDDVVCELDPPTCPFGKYSNEIDPMTSVALAGAGLQIADDLTLEGDGARDLTYLDLRVYGNGGGAFNVTVELWTDCPGDGGALIPDTTFTWTAVPDSGYVYTLVVDPLSPAVTIPDTVWMVATFTTPESGWIIAEQAELGTTADLYGHNDPPWACNYYFGGDPYAGLWANLRCVEGSSKRGSDGESRLSIQQVPTPLSIEAVGAGN